jgi:SAM-dependent methyltransferase
MEKLRIAPGPSFARDLISARILEHGRGLGRRVDILEAGCGREWNIDLTGLEVHLTGVDIDAKAIGHRRDVVGDLDEAIVGDLRTVVVPKAAYDVVFSAFVLEHIKGARGVLDAMVEALRPGGLLILRVPDGNSVYAFLARLLPFWTHVLYKRVTQRDPMAGKPGHPPYRVVYDEVVTRSALNAFAAERGLEILDELGTNPHIDNMGRLGGVGMFVQRLIARMSAGRLVGTHNNLTLIMKKAR